MKISKCSYGSHYIEWKKKLYTAYIDMILLKIIRILIIKNAILKYDL